MGGESESSWEGMQGDCQLTRNISVAHSFAFDSFLLSQATRAIS